MLWAACCTCFFGFLHSGEITVPLQKDYDSTGHLSYGDVTFDSKKHPSAAQIKIKASKTDPFRKEVTIHVGRTNNDLSPVAALAAYTTIRGTNDGPFFVLDNQAPLTREQWTVFIIIILNNAHQRGKWRETFLGPTAAHTFLLYFHALFEGSIDSCKRK